MKRISGGQLSREAKATLLSSHAGDPRTAAGDKTFVGQTKAADAVVKSQPAASPKDLPVGSDVTAQTAEDFDSESSLLFASGVGASRLKRPRGRGDRFLR
jgi:hypothetical protein